MDTLIQQLRNTINEQAMKIKQQQTVIENQDDMDIDAEQTPIDVRQNYESKLDELQQKVIKIQEVSAEIKTI